MIFSFLLILQIIDFSDSTATLSEITKSTYFVEEPDNDNEVSIISNGRETKFKKTVVVKTDEKELESDDEVEDEEYEDEELEDEEEFEDEEIEDEDETDIDESEMILDPNDVERYINFESVEDEEDVEDEEEVDDEEEMEDEEMEDEEEEVSDEESVVSEMDADSDDEGFIAGKDREAHIISKDKAARSSNTQLVDFDKFPFTNEDSVVTASRAFGFMISPCDVQTFFE